MPSLIHALSKVSLRGVKQLRGEAEANRSEIPHCVRNKLRNLFVFDKIATVGNDLAMTDAIDTCNRYRWIWESLNSVINL
jgi:hypothetical protein